MLSGAVGEPPSAGHSTDLRTRAGPSTARTPHSLARSGSPAGVVLAGCVRWPTSVDGRGRTARPRPTWPCGRSIRRDLRRRRGSLARPTPNDISSMFSTVSSPGPMRQLNSVVRHCPKLPIDLCPDRGGGRGPASSRGSETARPPRCARATCRRSSATSPVRRAPSVSSCNMSLRSLRPPSMTVRSAVATRASASVCRASPTRRCCRSRWGSSGRCSTRPMSGSQPPSPSVLVSAPADQRRPGSRLTSSGWPRTLTTVESGTDGMIIQHANEPMDAAKFGHDVRTARQRAGLPRPNLSFHPARAAPTSDGCRPALPRRCRGASPCAPSSSTPTGRLT